MDNCYGVIAFFLVMSVLVVAVNYYNDRNARRQKATVLSRLQNSGKFIHLDVRSSARAVSYIGFQFLWQRAEVIFIDNAVFYFGYFPMLFGLFRMYRGVVQLSNLNTSVPELLGDNRSCVIDSVKIDQKRVTIAYSKKNDPFLVKRTMNLTIDDVDQLEAIRQMLMVA